MIPATLDLLSKLLAPTGSIASSLSSYERELLAGESDLAPEFAPYIYYLLKQQGDPGLASAGLDGALRERALSAARVAMGRRVAIHRLGELLQNAGIPAMLLKGAAMDQWTYPDEGFRLGSDIDLLVREEDYAAIDEVIAPFASAQVKYPGRDAFNRFAVEKTFTVSSPATMNLDVHRNLTIPHVYRLNPDELFGRGLPHPAYPGLQVLNPEDNLLHFAVHSFYDMRLFNKQSMDALQLIAHTEIDWQELQQRAQRYRMQQPLNYFMYGLKQVFPGQLQSLPEGVGSPGPAKTLLTRCLLTASCETLSRRNASYRLRQILVQLVLSGNLVGYTRYNLAYLRARLAR
jgi:hypothetical protein